MSKCRNAQWTDLRHGANEPFTGTVTHVPDNSLLSDAAGYTKFMQRAVDTSDAVGESVLHVPGDDSPKFLCDVVVRKGYVDGKATCYRPRTDTQLIAANFSGGRLSGSFLLYDADKPRTKLVEGGFNDGKPDGTETIYSESSGKPVERVSWAEGKISGERKTWGTHGSLLTDEVYADGIKVADKKAQDAGHSDDASLQTRMEQALSGPVSTATAPAPSAPSALEPMPASASTASPATPLSLDACVQGWTSANLAAAAKAGVDDEASADQIDEWEAWCKQGKQAPAG